MSRITFEETTQDSGLTGWKSIKEEEKKTKNIQELHYTITVSVLNLTPENINRVTENFV